MMKKITQRDTEVRTQSYTEKREKNSVALCETSVALCVTKNI